jgi:hypothetical protein
MTIVRSSRLKFVMMLSGLFPEPGQDLSAVLFSSLKRIILSVFFWKCKETIKIGIFLWF